MIRRLGLPALLPACTLALSLSLGVTPRAPLAAQAAVPDSGAHIRVDGDVVVGPDAREAFVLVVRGTARVEGYVKALVVIDGTAILAGARVKDLTVVRGRAELSGGAVVEGDAHLLDSEITMAEGSSVAGEIERGMGHRLARDLVRLAALLGLGVLLAMIIAGIAAAAVAPEAVTATGRLIRADFGKVAGASALVWIAMPLVSIALLPTVVGIPMGLGYFFFVLPALAFLGLIVAGAWLGGELIHRVRAGGPAPRPTVAAAVGILVLMAMGRIPVLGLLTTLAVILGAGAVALAALRAARMPRDVAKAG